MVKNTKFWNKKKVLITGHTGFKGSWLSIWLKMLKSDVSGFSKDVPTIPSLFESAIVKEGMNSIFGDIRNFDRLKSVIEEFQPEIIFHMAAQSLVSKSYHDPVETYSTNIMGTVNILEAVREIGNPTIIINVTSDKCYENTGSRLGYKEEDRMGGYDPYSSSKGCCELISSAFNRSFFNSNKFDNHKISMATVRAGNVIGGGDWSENRLIPDIIRGIYSKEKIIIRNPNAIRPWQHILDPLSGYIMLAEKLDSNPRKFSGAWNFGPEQKNLVSVSQIIKKISKNGWVVESKNIEKSNYHEEEIIKLNSNKAKTMLGWNPKIDFEHMLELTIDWYKKYKTMSDTSGLCRKQIRKYYSL